MGLKSLLYNTYILKRFLFGYGRISNRSLNGQIVKELLDIAAPAA